jgi:hypothetical protein
MWTWVDLHVLHHICGQLPCWFQRSDIWQRYGKTCCIQCCKQIASLSCYCCVFRWVHTCNAIARRNSVTWWVTDTIRSYGLNFHPVPHGVTISCERYTLGLREPKRCLCSQQWLRTFIYTYILRFKEKEKRAAVVAKATVHKQGSARRFKFAGRLWIFSRSVGYIRIFHQNVSQWIWIFN